MMTPVTIAFITLFLVIKSFRLTAGSIAKPNCEDMCGNTSIPFPFGIGAGCYLEGFEVTCNQSFHPSMPFLKSINMELRYVFLVKATVTVNNPAITSKCASRSSYSDVSLSGSPFSFSYTLQLVNTECFLGVLDWGVDTGVCRGDRGNSSTFCSADSSCLNTINSSYTCSCHKGYVGNPYLPRGCQDICSSSYNCWTHTKMILTGVGSGVGILFALIGGLWLYKVVKRRRLMMLKRKFFKRNGGLLLQQKVISSEGSLDVAKLFTSKELERSTDGYNRNRILGQGGQGTVYKGMLTDGKIVAVKKSKIVDEGYLEQFINEVVILSQISHRNVVKLLGCCLETEVPLLVYEFIPNGTLSEYILNPNESFPLTWEMRLRVASEVAGALFYLHSAASMPIYHRDVKSTNILLDDKYRAKVSDFGTSRSVAVDQTHLTTKVLGTFGYMDPEYFQSSQFTDKSDVYSFGVVLVELLTGKKPISLIGSEEERSLANHFLVILKQDRLFEIIDARILKDGNKEEIMAVAQVARRCLNLSGKKRPTMKEVAVELENIRMSGGGIAPEEYEYATTEIAGTYWDSNTNSYMENSDSVSLDVQQSLLLNK